MMIFDILKNLYTNPSSKWILDVKDSEINPVIIQRYLSLNRSVHKETSFLNKFAYSLPPKMYLSAVWSALFINKKKYTKAPFVKYPKKDKELRRYSKLFEKIKRHLELSDKDMETNMKFLLPYIKENIVELFSFYGMDESTWTEHNLDFDNIRLYGNRPKVENKKGLDVWFS